MSEHQTTGPCAGEERRADPRTCGECLHPAKCLLIRHELYAGEFASLYPGVTTLQQLPLRHPLQHPLAPVALEPAGSIASHAGQSRNGG
jgi:hypothetical protein